MSRRRPASRIYVNPNFSASRLGGQSNSKSNRYSAPRSFVRRQQPQQQRGRSQSLQGRRGGEYARRNIGFSSQSNKGQRSKSRRIRSRRNRRSSSQRAVSMRETTNQLSSLSLARSRGLRFGIPSLQTNERGMRSRNRSRSSKNRNSKRSNKRSKRMAKARHNRMPGGSEKPRNGGQFRAAMVRQLKTVLGQYTKVMVAGMSESNQSQAQDQMMTTSSWAKSHWVNKWNQWVDEVAHPLIKQPNGSQGLQGQSQTIMQASNNNNNNTQVAKFEPTNAMPNASFKPLPPSGLQCPMMVTGGPKQNVLQSFINYVRTNNSGSNVPIKSKQQGAMSPNGQTAEQLPLELLFSLIKLHTEAGRDWDQAVREAKQQPKPGQMPVDEQLTKALALYYTAIGDQTADPIAITPNRKTSVVVPAGVACLAPPQQPLLEGNAATKSTKQSNNPIKLAIDAMKSLQRKANIKRPDNLNPNARNQKQSQLLGYITHYALAHLYHHKAARNAEMTLNVNVNNNANLNHFARHASVWLRCFSLPDQETFRTSPVVAKSFKDRIQLDWMLDRLFQLTQQRVHSITMATFGPQISPKRLLAIEEAVIREKTRLKARLFEASLVMMSGEIASNCNNTADIDKPTSQLGKIWSLFAQVRSISCGRLELLGTPLQEWKLYHSADERKSARKAERVRRLEELKKLQASSSQAQQQQPIQILPKKEKLPESSSRKTPRKTETANDSQEDPFGQITLNQGFALSSVAIKRGQVIASDHVAALHWLRNNHSGPYCGQCHRRIKDRQSVVRCTKCSVIQFCSEECRMIAVELHKSHRPPMCTDHHWFGLLGARGLLLYSLVNHLGGVRQFAALFDGSKVKDPSIWKGWHQLGVALLLEKPINALVRSGKEDPEKVSLVAAVDTYQLMTILGATYQLDTGDYSSLSRFIYYLFLYLARHPCAAPLVVSSGVRKSKKRKPKVTSGLAVNNKAQNNTRQAALVLALGSLSGVLRLDCSGNVRLRFNDRTGSVQYLAKRDIQPGEPLTVACPLSRTIASFNGQQCSCVRCACSGMRQWTGPRRSSRKSRSSRIRKRSYSNSRSFNSFSSRSRSASNLRRG